MRLTVPSSFWPHLLGVREINMHLQGFRMKTLSYFSFTLGNLTLWKSRKENYEFFCSGAMPQKVTGILKGEQWKGTFPWWLYYITNYSYRQFSNNCSSPLGSSPLAFTVIRYWGKMCRVQSLPLPLPYVMPRCLSMALVYISHIALQCREVTGNV